jgi:hypothetical protein
MENLQLPLPAEPSTDWLQQSRAEQSSSLLPAASHHGHSWHRAPLGPMAIYLFSVKTFVFFSFVVPPLIKREGLDFFIIGVPLTTPYSTRGRIKVGNWLQRLTAEQSSSLLPATSQHGHSWHRTPLGPMAIYLFCVKTFFFFFFRCSSFDKREGLGFFFVIGVPLLHLFHPRSHWATDCSVDCLQNNSLARTPQKTCLLLSRKRVYLPRYLAIDICEPHRKRRLMLLRMHIYCPVT